MPGCDGTGPMGYGSLNERGFGPCGRGLAFRKGFGRGFGGGFGRRWSQGLPFAEPVDLRYPEQAALTKEEQKKILEAELKEIEEEKQEIEKRLKELR